MKTGICKICGSGFIGSNKDRVCSKHECWIGLRRKIYSCHGCSEKDLKYRLVKFKDGTEHVQEYCTSCLKTTWVSHWKGYEMGLMEKPNFHGADFLTDAAKDYNP